MKPGLKKQIDDFYEEMYKEESFDIGEMACDLVPRLVYEILKLEKQVHESTCKDCFNYNIGDGVDDINKCKNCNKKLG